MKISVIVPVYKVEPYIHRCVDSILNQTFTDYELILVDDGSPDNCGAICDEYAAKENRIVVIHKENGGLSDARNAGIDWAFANSDSEWITFIDSDDWIHPRYLELLYDAVNENSLLVSSCGYLSTGEKVEDKELVDVSVIIDSPENLKIRDRHDWFNPSVAWGRLYHKALFSEIRYPFGKFYEDGFTTHRILFSLDRIAVVDAKLYYWYSNPESINRSKPTPEKVNDFIDAMLAPLSYYYDNGFYKAYIHEVSLFLYRLDVHLANYKDIPELQDVNRRFILEARKLIRRNRKNLSLSKYDDGYKMVFDRYEYLFYKILNKFGL